MSTVTLYGIDTNADRKLVIVSVEAEETKKSYKLAVRKSWLGYAKLVSKTDHTISLSPEAALEKAIRSSEAQLEHAKRAILINERMLEQLNALRDQLETPTQSGAQAGEGEG